MKQIGKIAAAHGVNGDITIAHYITNTNKIKDIDVLMIEVWNNSFIPFFIEEIDSITHDSFLVKFEEINSREEAKKFINKNVYLYNENLLQTHSQSEWEYLIHFTIFNQNNLKIGEIKDVFENSMQILLEVEYQDKIIQLPLHQNLILKLDEKQKIIKINIAEGLLEML